MLFVLTDLPFAVSVYTLDEQFYQTNQTLLRFRIENNSDDTLKGVELRYRVVQDSSDIAEPELYYLPNGIASWTFEDSDSATLVVYFPDEVLYPGDTLGGTSGFAVGLHRKDWNTWTKADDPSQPKSNHFSLAENVEVLSGGKSLMLGIGKITGCPVLQFVEFQKDSVSLHILQQLDGDISTVAIKNYDGAVIEIDLNEAFVDSLGQKIWRGFLPVQDSMNRRGEVSVECNGNLLAYFAYGWTPANATRAVEKNLWESRESFVKADFDMGFNQGLGEGQRLALQRDSAGNFMDARYTANWKFYRSWERPGENSMPIVLSSPLMQYDESDIDSISLEWSPVDGADWYRLIVLRDSLVGDSVVFTDTTVSLFTERTFVKIPVLAAGNYLWFVEPLHEVAMDDDREGEEYYVISGDDEITEWSGGGNYPVVQRSWWRKVVKWSKTTVKRAVKHFAPVTYSLIYGENAFSNTWSSIKNHANPFGFLQIFLHQETLYISRNDVKKNMTWLKDVYVKKHVYTINTSKIDELLSNKCFGKNAFCAMKDSRMLADRWGTGFTEANWNKVFLRIDIEGKPNNAVNNRCWLTMAQMLNHYKGGNMASDEILYRVRGGFGNTDGGGAIETMQAVNYALNQSIWNRATYTAIKNSYESNGIFPSVDGWFVGTPLLHTIITTIEMGNVIGVSQLNVGANGAHSMVLDGYKITNNGSVYVHLLNTDNLGNSEWRYYCSVAFFGLDALIRAIANGIGNVIDMVAGTNIGGDLFFSYYIPPLYAKGRNADVRVFVDSDGDGIMDIDENERFGTDASKADSDGDGIEDFREILDYKLCETKNDYYMPFVFDGTGVSTQPVNIPQMSYILQSDFDGDGLHVAIDPDSDGDGFCDNQESGYIGNFSKYNCSRFDATKYPEGVKPLCKDYSAALLAKESLRLNDRTNCVSLNGSLCPVVSFGGDFSGEYGVSLGADARVGTVYSYKSVLLRDRAVVQGNLETANSVVRQSSTAVVAGRVIENSTRGKIYENVYSSFLNTAVLGYDDFSITSHRVVNTGEFLYSGIFGLASGHVDYTFNSGSELKFNVAGSLFAGSLKFQHGAKLNVPASGVTFYVGNDFLWNGSLVTDDMVAAARKIKVYYYGTERVDIHANFAGTIVAPNAEVVIGQSGKHYFGAIYAKKIVVHQDTKVTWVPFEETQPMLVDNFVIPEAPFYAVNFFEGR